MNKRFSIKALSIVLSICLSAGTFLSGAGSEFHVYAANNASPVYKTGDIAKVDIPKMEMLEEVVVDKLPKYVRNATNFNTGVATGKHYEKLDNNEKIVYRAMVAASSHVFPYGAGISENDIGNEGVAPLALNESTKFSVNASFQDAYEAARYDHPELVQLTLSKYHTTYRGMRDSSTGRYLYNTYLYMSSADENYTQSDFDDMTQEIIAKRAEILAAPEITSAKGIIGRELAVHDKIMEMNTYDDDCADNGDAEHLSHTAYGSLITGTAVCDGYAMGLAYLLQGLHIDALVISGDAGGGHAWNIVKQGSDWYEVDATWDDQDGLTDATPELEKEVRHLYYHLTTAQISNYQYNVVVGNRSVGGSSRRIRDGFSLDLPTATGTRYNWQGVKAHLDSAADIEVPVTAVTVDKTRITDLIGTTGQITAQVQPADATNQDVHFKSTNEDVIIVDENGNYEVIGAGSAVIRVITDDRGMTTDVAVNIPNQAPEVKVTGISISSAAITGKIGDSGVISYSVAPENATNQNVSVEVSNENVVSVSRKFGTGLYYKIVGKGTSTIKFKTEDGGYEAVCTVKVSVPSYKIFYNANGGTINGVGQIYKSYDEGSTASPSDVVEPVRYGYDFAGWYDMPTGGNKFEGCTVTEELVLYAQWTSKQTNLTTPENGNNDASDTGSTDEDKTSQKDDSSDDDPDNKASTSAKQKDDPTKAKLIQDKNSVKLSKLKKKSQKVTVKVERSKGKITVKNTTSKKLKKYLTVKVNGRKVICTVKKGAKKGTYKVKVTVAKKGKYKKTVETIKIVVK